MDSFFDWVITLPLWTWLLVTIYLYIGHRITKHLAGHLANSTDPNEIDESRYISFIWVIPSWLIAVLLLIACMVIIYLTNVRGECKQRKIQPTTSLDPA